MGDATATDIFTTAVKLNIHPLFVLFEGNARLIQRFDGSWFAVCNGISTLGLKK